MAASGERQRLAVETASFCAPTFKSNVSTSVVVTTSGVKNVQPPPRAT
jgi:hypothetical protein